MRSPAWWPPTPASSRWDRSSGSPSPAPAGGTYTVTDTGAAVKGHDVDIFMTSCAAAKRFGKRLVTARVLKRGPAPDAR